MFDFHMHTSFSDGQYSVEELLDLLRRENISYYSITDHNHCLAYENFDYRKYPIITGTELATSFQGNIIEILGYDINPEMINDWFKRFFSQEELKKKELFLFHRLKKIVLKQGLLLSEPLLMSDIKKGISKTTIYYDAIKHNVDFKIQYPTYKVFFRQALSNPESEYFLNEALTYPALEDVIDLIHKADGKVMLAHPYEYMPAILNDVLQYSAQKLDGVECFHPSISMNQSVSLFQFCEEHHLLAVGGSDFHHKKRSIRMGVRVSEEFYDRQPFVWLHNRISKEQFL